MAELIERSTRGLFRDLTTSSTIGRITTAFQDAGFAPNPDCAYQDGSERRETAEAYLQAVNWSDLSHVRRFLRVAERILVGWELQQLRSFYDALQRDGCQIDEKTGHMTLTGPPLSIASIALLKDPSAIQEGLERIRRAVDDDPALAIGGAKELIETTAKVVLRERFKPFDDRDKLPKLTQAAQTALGLDPKSATGPDGSAEVKRILGAVSTIAIGLAELRNRGHGTGHGPATARVGLSTRHAHLAVNAAITWCQLMLDTLADPQAPWRQHDAPDAP